MTLPWSEKLIRAEFIVAALTVFVIVAGGIFGYGQMTNQLANAGEEIATQGKDIKALEKRADSQDIANAEQTVMIQDIKGDVSDMKGDLKEIKKILYKLAGGP